VAVGHEEDGRGVGEEEDDKFAAAIELPRAAPAARGV
jgi:hypothetical protein